MVYRTCLLSLHAVRSILVEAKITPYKKALLPVQNQVKALLEFYCIP